MRSISKRLRFSIFERDGFRCRYCGTSPEIKELRVDHIFPVAKGGTDDAFNLITACHDCNSGKSAETFYLLAFRYFAMTLYRDVMKGLEAGIPKEELQSVDRICAQFFDLRHFITDTSQPIARLFELMGAIASGEIERDTPGADEYARWVLKAVGSCFSFAQKQAQPYWVEPQHTGLIQ